MKLSIIENIKSAEMQKAVHDAMLSTQVSAAARRLMDDYVPFDEGVLAGTAQAGSGEVIYGVNYAVYPYSRKVNFKKDRHPKATNKWDKASIGENCNGPEGAKFKEEVAKTIKERLK